MSPWQQSPSLPSDRGEREPPLPTEDPSRHDGQAQERPSRHGSPQGDDRESQHMRNG